MNDSSPITRKDLDEALEKQEVRIEKLFDAKIAPIVESNKAHQKALFGTSGTNGIVKSVNVLIWGYGLGAIVLGILIHKIFIL